ncbi:MAG: hypothetical protein A2Z57_03375 [Planctomycetes bacterium RIFCSPHIGHO2_12_39_6]|nr:MAG: hypothetical protein A2Z57_03375 [Planctomycetes bacterium RIFCSPHIGHO2_12_39_6]
MNIANGVLIDVRDAATIMFGNTITGNIMTEQEKYINNLWKSNCVLIEGQDTRGYDFKVMYETGFILALQTALADKGEACKNAYDKYYPNDCIGEKIRNAVPQTKEVRDADN